MTLFPTPYFKTSCWHLEIRPAGELKPVRTEGYLPPEDPVAEVCQNTAVSHLQTL